MKIKLLLTLQEGKFPDLKLQYKAVANLKEANSLDRGSIDKETYSHIQALEHNKDFVDEITKMRKRYNIPSNGYTHTKWYKLKTDKTADPDFRKWRTEIAVNSRKAFIEKFNIPYLLHNNLFYIVIGSYVLLPLPKIYIDIPYVARPAFDGPELSISIRGSISKQRLITFIRNNWDTIFDNLAVFQTERSLFISSRDQEIIKLRDIDKLTFNEIANRFAENIDDYDINEDMIKKAYHRAKDKINTISKK